MKYIIKGFTLLEILITVAVAGILGTIGVTSYNEFVVNSTQEVAAHDMLNTMTDFEKFYSKNGTYAQASGRAPNDVISELNMLNLRYTGKYAFNCYPSNLCNKSTNNTNGKLLLTTKYNLQNVCINAIPNDNSIMRGRYISVDEQGYITKNIVPKECGGDGPNPRPDPTEQPRPSPTTSPTDEPSPSPTVSPTPEPSPSPTEGPNPYNVCYVNGTINYSDPKAFSECTVGTFGDASGHCDTGKWRRCSGDCNYTLLCDPNETGCSGNCRNAFIYDAPCSGWCNGSTFFIEKRDPNSICTSGCTDLKFYLPKSRYPTMPAICNRDGNSCTLY